MPKYIVEVVETLATSVLVEADDEVEASDIVELAASNGDFTLSCEDFVGRDIYVQGEVKTRNDCAHFPEIKRRMTDQC